MALPSFLSAAPSLTLTTSFAGADVARTNYMDVGGVWNGTTEVTATTGDTFSLQMCNNSTATVYNIAPVVTLPSNFNYVAGTAAGITGISANQAGVTLTFSFSGQINITTGTCRTLTYGLTTTTTASAGTFLLTPQVGFGSAPGGTGLSNSTSQSILVKEGATTITKTPGSQTKAIGQAATWSVTVQNTGLGGLFNVEINENAINPGTSLSLTTLTQTSPVSPSAVATSGRLTLPYLNPGQQFVATASATVTGCLNILNISSTTDRTALTLKSGSAQVVIDLQQPQISFTPSSGALNYGSTRTYTVPILNAGLGAATTFYLQTNLNSMPLTISNVSAGWSYNASNGRFTRTASSGTLVSGFSGTLSYDAAANDPCTIGTSNIVWVANYNDTCGNPFNAPTQLSSITPPTAAPAIDLNKSVSSRLVVAEAGSYALTLSAASLSYISTDPILVQDVLPTNITGVTVVAPGGTSASCSGPCVAGSTVTWSVPKSVLTSTQTLTINFTAPSAPCAGGTFLVNTSTVSAVTTAGCPLSDASNATALIINNPQTVVLQNFNISTPADGTYETGAPDDGDGVQESPTEGEFIISTATYQFPSGSTSTWAGSIYSDNFAGLAGGTYVPGSLRVSIDGAPSVAVPGGSITASPGSLSVDLAFLAGPSYVNDPTTNNHQIDLTYKWVAQDSDLNGATNASETTIVTLEISGGGAGSCSGSNFTYKQGDFFTIARARVAPSLSMPSTIDKCELFPVTLSQTNSNAGSAEYPSNVSALVYSTGSYTYYSPQTPTYGGVFTGGNITYTENGGNNPTFDFTPTSTELTAEGTITFLARRRAGTGSGLLTMDSLSSYDDNQTAGTIGRDFASGASASPVLMKTAQLALLTSPQTVSVSGSTATVTYYVTNGGSGGSFGTTLNVQVPTGLTINTVATDALNVGIPVSVGGSTLTWVISPSTSSLSSGQTQAIQAVFNVSGGACSIPAQSNSVTGTWGCDGTTEQTVLGTNPNFIFPAGQLQVLHDSSQTRVDLCGSGTDEIIVRNVGATHVYGVQVNEIIKGPPATGIDIVSGSVQISTNAGVSYFSLGVGGDPTGSGTSGSPYVWTSAQIPALADLSPQSEGTGISDVRIRVTLTSVETTNGLTPTLSASATGSTACGSSVSNSEGSFTITVRKPDITVTKVGRNITLNPSGSYGSTVLAGTGDTVQWRISVQNTGNYAAQNVRIADVFAGSGGSAIINGPGLSSATITNNSPLTIPDISSGTTATYIVTETVGGVCVNNQPNTADVTWGCVNNGATTRSNLSTPTDNTDAANLQLTPDFSGSNIQQTFTPLSGGRTQVTLTINNTGGEAQSFSITDTLPAGQEIDTTYSSTFTTTGNLSGFAVAGSSTVPQFNFTGTLEGGTSVTVTFRIIQTGNFDGTTNALNAPDTVGNGQDPSLPSAANNVVQLNYQSSCGDVGSASNSTSLDPATPDVDISVALSTIVVSDGQVVNFVFTLTNNGDSGSIADHIAFSTTTMGAGWTGLSLTVTTPGTGGTGGACTGLVCTESQIGQLSQGQTATLTLSGTANDNGSSLAIVGRVIGSLYRNNGTDTGNDYSFDSVQPRVTGFRLQKTLQSTSETTTTGSNVTIGEDVTWRLEARWFGGDAISNITVRDTLPAGLGYVSFSTASAHDVTISSFTAPAPVTSGVINFTVSTIPGGSGTFQTDLVSRVLNIPGNTNGTVLTNNLGARYAVLGSTFASNNATDAFGGSESSLHQQSSATIVRPSLTLDKQVRNVTTGSSFAQSGTGQGNDTVEYRITLSNTGSSPAFDITLQDVLSTTKLVMIDGASDGVDNDGDGFTDFLDVIGEGGYYAVAGGSVTFTAANTFNLLGNNLSQLNSGQSLTFYYRTLINTTASPNDTLGNLVTMTASTLPGVASDEAILTSTDTANIQISTAAITKALIATSVNGDANANMVIGEQATFQLTMQLPVGTVPAFRVFDSLPTGLALVQTSSVTFGSAISPTSQPTITPGSLPANGPQLITWNFGTLTVSTSAVAADRTVTIPYIVQMRNIAGNANGTNRVNASSFTYTGTPFVNISSITVTSRLPSVVTTKSVAPLTTVDAGDVLTYTIRLDNSTGTVGAYDVNIRDVIPSAASYIPGTTSIVSGGPLTEPDVSGSTLTWGRTQAVPQTVNVSSSSALEFTYQVRVSTSMLPSQLLVNSARADWTSLPGNPGPNLGVAVGTAGASNGERDGSGAAPNDYFAVRSTTTTAKNIYSQLKVASTGTIAGAFRVGDLVTYTLTLNFQEGTVNNLRIQDTLPTGLAFDSFDPITPVSNSTITYTAPVGGNAPVIGSTGTITWVLGTLINAGDNNATDDALTLTYRARVIDTNGIAVTPVTQALSNSVVMRYDNYQGSAQVTTISSTTISTVQPRLGSTKTLLSGSSVTAGSTVSYRVTVSNTGSAPAYNPIIADTLPVGMRQSTATLVASSLNGGSVSPLSQINQVYYSSSGVVTWALPDGLILNAGQTWSVDYNTVVDAGVGGALFMQNSAQVDAYYSEPSTATVRRQYAPTTASTTTVTTPSPTTMGKIESTTTLRVGDSITYNLYVPSNTVNVAVYDARIVDSIASGLTISSVTTNASTLPAGACGTINLTDFSTGNDVDLQYSCIPPNAQAIVTITARVRDIPGNVNGTTFPNSGSFTWSSVPAGDQQAPIVSNSTSSVVVEPNLSSLKTRLSGANVTAGSVVNYRLTVTNSGTSPAYNLALLDVIPSGLRQSTPTVVAATINGGAIVPLSQVDPVWSSSSGVLTWNFADALALNAGQTLVLDYNATVDPNVGGGLTLTNGALVTASYSVPSTPGSPDRRTYAPTSISSASVNTPAPTDMRKTSDKTLTNIGETVTYTLYVPSTTVNVAVFDARVQDSLPTGVRFSSMTTNASSLTGGTCGTVNASNNTSGNNVDVTLSCIPAGQQAVVTITGIVDNVIGNQAGTNFANSASYTWSQTSGGATQSPITSNTTTTTATEPVVTIDKTLASQSIADVAQGLQAGDSVTYTITVVNSSGTNAGSAHDIVVRDVIDSHLITPVMAANPDNPGAPTNEGTSGGLTTYSWTIAGPLAAGATYQFNVTFTLDSTVQPMQALVNNSSVTWTSLAGTDPEERTGAGGVNDYLAIDGTPVSIMVGPVHVEKDIKSPGGSTYAVGSDVTYRLAFTFGQGVVQNVHVFDALPTGLSYVSAVVVSSNSQAMGGGAISLISPPTAGATGTLDFNLGHLESTAPFPGVFVDVTARVQDVGGNTAGTVLTNGVSAQVNTSTGGVAAIVPTNPLPPITVLEPSLRLALDAPATLDLGTPAIFTARVVNSTATTVSNGYQPTYQIQLPAGTRTTNPTALPISLAISGGRTLSLAAGTDYTVSYSSTTGIFQTVLTSSISYLAPGETLTTQFRVALDSDAVNGATIDLTGTVTQFYSQDTSAGLAADTRAYPLAFGTGTTGTADAAAPDDRTDNAQTTVRAPVITITKQVDKPTATLPPDTSLHYTITIANSGSIATSSSTFTDDIGAFTPSSQYFISGSLSGVSVTGAPGGFVDVSSATAGSNGKGLVQVTGLVIPVGSVNIQFDEGITTVIPNATVLKNQASLSVPGFSQPMLSDSNNAGDNDGAETGNNSGNADDDDPTRTVIGSAAAIEFTKTSVDDNGGTLLAGETITYTLTVSNRGTERILNSRITDSVPVNSSYVANSTLLNGTPVADVSGFSPLVSGMEVHTVLDSTGTVRVCPSSAPTCGINESVTVQFQVRVSSNVTAGTLISNQGLYSGQGEGTSTPTSKYSDDPNTTPSPDPTINVVAGAAYLESEKTVDDINGGSVMPGDVLEYTIRLVNRTSVAANNVRIIDSIPLNTTYIPGTIQYDVDKTTVTTPTAGTDVADSDAVDFNVTTSSGITVVVSTFPANGEVYVVFRASVSASAPIGTIISNQAITEAAGLADTYSDGDGNHGNGDQPTRVVVGNVPALIQTMRVTDLNGGSVEAGDVVEYEIQTFNVGVSSATNVVVISTGPDAGLVYVPSSTSLDGVSQSDISSDSALVTGINTGALLPGASNLIRVRYTIPLGISSGTYINNQAHYTADGGLSGISDSDLDDNVEFGNLPTDPNDDDPTRLQVGGSPGRANLSGTVWLDVNHDRAISSGEARQSGWSVEVVKNGAIVASAITDASGDYHFTNLTPGTGYQIRFRHPVSNVVYGGAISSRPEVSTQDGTIRFLTLASGENVIDQNLPLDPNGVIYDAVTRQPIPGVVVYLDGPSGSDFDPAYHLLPGQQGQTTASDGFYRFDLVLASTGPFGVYTLRMDVPAGYLPSFPSNLIVPSSSTVGCLDANCLDVPAGPGFYLVAPQATAPTGSDPTTYYIRFQFDSNTDLNVVNNHVPLDPILDNALTITKTAAKREATRGDFVPYTVTARNNFSAVIPNININDLLPPGFKYVKGSAKLNGVPVEPTVDGRSLTWANLTFSASEVKTFTLITVIGSAVNDGVYVNEAWGTNNIVNRTVSNRAQASVKVVPDPTFDCPELIGKVFDDKNANGYPDELEPGIAGVNLVSLRGWIIKTDYFGRYHIMCPMVPDPVRGSNYILKLDTRTLPLGYRLTTENPGDVRLTRGKVSKLNFGASLYQVVRLDLSSKAFDAKDPEWSKVLDKAISIAESKPTVFRLAYCRDQNESDAQVKTRLKSVSAETLRRWKTKGNRETLHIEVETKGEYCRE